MSESPPIDSDGLGEDPSDASLLQMMDDLDEADQGLEPISEISEEFKFQGQEMPEEKEDISILEKEKSGEPDVSEPQPARDAHDGDVEMEITKVIHSNSENASRHSSDTPRQESSPVSAPVQKKDVTASLPNASTGPAKTDAKKQKPVKGIGQNRSSSTAAGTPQPAEWLYQAAAHVIQNPYGSANTTCVGQAKAGRQVHEYAKPNSSRRRSIRNLCFLPSTNPYGEEAVMWQVNPAASVPMRAPSWRASGFRKPRSVPVEEWKKRDNAVKEKRNRELAIKLGYETRVGNLVHINIPGARDLNRSWNHFLNQDTMSWGFPYWKGSTERPQVPTPPPYLVHELKEKFWKHPRARSFKTA